MIREGHDDTTMFVGREVEHTPAYGMRTLFVVGLQDPKLILTHAVANKCDHIYFGANQSFPNLGYSSPEWSKWESLVHFFLRGDYWCTLDIDVNCAEGLLESGLIESYKFIPLISVKLPYIQQLGYNATIKLDDKDFNLSNPGVWCHSLHKLMNRDCFTDWSKYTKDEVLK